MSEIDLLDGIMTKTGDLIAGVDAGARRDPTPCTEMDVAAMVDHLVGWAPSFAAGAQGTTYEGDPTAVRAGDDPASEFRAQAADIVDGWRKHGLDRTTSMGGGEQPAEMVFNMTLMEYLTHGWDLAVGSGQEVPFTEDEAAQVLARAEVTLPPQYRGDDMPFGEIVPVPETAPAIDRLAGFMGRDPSAATRR
jgi:uncharacterized protein (TIGR03086 family)